MEAEVKKNRREGKILMEKVKLMEHELATANKKNLKYKHIAKTMKKTVE